MRSVKMAKKNEIKSTGESIAHKLKKGGYDTLEKIANAKSEEILKKTKLNENVLKTIIIAAKQKIKIIEVKSHKKVVKIKKKPKKIVAKIIEEDLKPNSEKVPKNLVGVEKTKLKKPIKIHKELIKKAIIKETAKRVIQKYKSRTIPNTCVKDMVEIDTLKLIKGSQELRRRLIQKLLANSGYRKIIISKIVRKLISN